MKKRPITPNMYGHITINDRNVAIRIQARGGSTPQGGPDPVEYVDWEMHWDDTGEEFTFEEYEQWGEYILDNCESEWWGDEP